MLKDLDWEQMTCGAGSGCFARESTLLIVRMACFGKYTERFRFHRSSVRLGFSIPINTFREGLYISHWGTITVNGRARIGKNCRIQEGVNIGDSRGGYRLLGTMYTYVQELRCLEKSKLQMML